MLTGKCAAIAPTPTLWGGVEGNHIHRPGISNLLITVDKEAQEH